MYVNIENDSHKTRRLRKNSPRNNSKLSIPNPARIDANKEYLFLLKNPVKMIQKVNRAENSDE